MGENTMQMAQAHLMPLRIVYCTREPGMVSVDVPTAALAHTLRAHGDACMIVVERLPLPSADMDMAEQLGIEYIALPFIKRGAVARAEWRAFIERFRPDSIHFGPDIPATAVQALMQEIPLQRYTTVIRDDLHMLPHLPSRRAAVWHPLLHLSATTPHPAVGPTGSTSPLPRRVAPQMIDQPPPVMSEHEPSSVALSFVSLADPANTVAILDLLHTIKALIPVYPTSTYAILVQDVIQAQCKVAIAPALAPHIALITREDVWQREALSAIAALGGTYPVAPHLLGAALALNRPAIFAATHGADLEISAAPQVCIVEPGDASMFQQQIAVLIAQQLEVKAASGASPTAQEVAQQQRWMYYGVKMRASGAPVGKRVP
jgi:hypothetical protein